jgi:hypothetical protein
MFSNLGLTQNNRSSYDNNPFSFTESRNADFYPFTSVELKNLKESHIDGIDVSSCDWNVKGYTDYIFNSNSMLINAEIYPGTKRRRPAPDLIRYNIDSTFKLLAKEKKVSGASIEYDSMVYDAKDRLIYKEYSLKIWSKKKKAYVLDSLFKLELLESSNEGVFLVNKTDNSKRYINNKNETYRFESDKRIDSMSIELKDDNVEIKSFWYKHSTDSLFKIGLKQEFENSILQKETLYDYFPSMGQRMFSKYYNYNQDGLLVLSYLSGKFMEGWFDQKVYLYGYEGRIGQIITIDGNVSNCIDISCFIK